MLTTQRPSLQPMEMEPYHLQESSSPRQFAIPASRSRQPSGGLTYAEHAALRQRKTPHGRIFEHDTTAQDDHVHMPASKHLLLSSPQVAAPHPRDIAQIRQTDQVAGQRYMQEMSRQQQDRKVISNLQDVGQPVLGGLDSLLHQNPPLQGGQRGYIHGGARVPTVLPAAYQFHQRPTASAGHQVYGPYWPDGTFSPYRPASVRVNRYPSPETENVSLSSHKQTLPILRRPSKIQNFQDHADHQTARYPPIGSTGPTAVATVPPKGMMSGDYYVGIPQLAWNTFTPGSDRITFRDKTFSWANQVYVDLLASLQTGHANANHVHTGPNAIGQNATQSRTAIKPTIFPQPPKRSESHIQGFDLRSYHSINSHDVQHRPQTAIHIVQEAGDCPLDSRSSTRQGSQASAYSFERGESATKALNQMELLCEEAGTPWVDGMLLAGCLAYGLSHFSKALHWFQAILYQDQTHVEAMSNLAATLLALNHRDEALHHWTMAVRLRPSYFEAVEHLIGLLCSMQKAQDAVEMIEFVQSSLRIGHNQHNGESETKSRTSSIATTASLDHAHYDYESEWAAFSPQSTEQAAGFGLGEYGIPGADNGRMLALVHAKGNMLYSLGNNHDAAAAFEDAILISTGRYREGIPGLIREVLVACSLYLPDPPRAMTRVERKEPILLAPEQAEMTVKNMFPPSGQLPGLVYVTEGLARKAAIATTSNSLLSLAKIYQDGMSINAHDKRLRQTCTQDILALYYLSLSLQRSPSTANNVGILMAGVQPGPHASMVGPSSNLMFPIAGVSPGTGVALALAYYNYGLNLDNKHAHLYTNLGSLLKDIGQLPAAVRMYEMAVECEGNFDIALANLANAVKDQGKIAEAISYYQRAVSVNPNFVEATCGLATALNSVCNWYGRGGIFADDGHRDRIHVDEAGQMHQATRSWGWMNRVVSIVNRQLKEGESWGMGCLTPEVIDSLCQQLCVCREVTNEKHHETYQDLLRQALNKWAGQKWEGSRVVRLVERAIRYIGWQWYQDLYVRRRHCPKWKYARPKLPSSLTVPSAPTVLPFHTFTAPLSAKSIRQISQRNALRISVSTLNMSWLPNIVYPPPRPPSPCLNVGYLSSDFNNHPLAHLMQSVFGLHDRSKVKAVCYATSSSDQSLHRIQIEREAPVFYDASGWNVEKLVGQIVQDNIHVLVNLNGYTRGARNEVFAARPAPIQMSFMGFAGTLGAEWCDYVVTDMISTPLTTLSSWRRNVDVEDRLHPECLNENEENWVYAENVIYTKHTFFCVDHKQSAPDAGNGPPPSHDPDRCEMAWQAEQARRWKLRKEIFPQLAEDAVILGNFNQLYKIDPATFRMYLRVLAAVPNAILWLLKFPELGEHNLLKFARLWAGEAVARRVIFTDVASKGSHITRASLVDLFLDTPECNAHTTAADVVWSGTPILTWGRWEYKMCSRIAGSIMSSALPAGSAGDAARQELITRSEQQYEEHAIRLAAELHYPKQEPDLGKATGRLMQLRRMLWEGRWTSPLFDTARWVRDIEKAYAAAWRNYVDGQGGDIWL